MTANQPLLSTIHRRLQAGCLLAAVLAWCTLAGAQAVASKGTSLQVYFIDVEGGQATLFVAPEGKSLLIDTGWAGKNGLDAERIAATAKLAGLSKIDYVLITHFHADHVGGVPELVQRIPVGTFIDHGPNRENVEQGFEAYQKVLATGHHGHIVAKPGDVLPIPGMKVQVISADGQSIGDALPGAGEPNPYCSASTPRPPDQTENARSLGVLITFGKLTILDLGDLTWDKEMQLMCPVNKLGKVDIWVVSHHGWDQSSSPALAHAIQSRVDIMDNGATKGGSPPTFKTLAKAPGLETLWQLHYANEAGDLNTAPEYIANEKGPEDAAHYLKLTANPSGSFAVFNSRTGASKSYPAR